MGDVCMARIFCERTTLVLFGDDDDLSRSWRDEDGSSAMETGVKRDFVLVAVGRGGVVSAEGSVTQPRRSSEMPTDCIRDSSGSI